MMVHHWHTDEQGSSLLFCSSLLSCRLNVGQKGKNSFLSLVQETLQGNGNSSLISSEQFLFCAPSSSVVSYPKGAEHGVSWLSYMQHGRTQNWGMLWKTDFWDKSQKGLRSSFVLLGNMWAHGFYRTFLGNQNLYNWTVELLAEWVGDLGFEEELWGFLHWWKIPFWLPQGLSGTEKEKHVWWRKLLWQGFWLKFSLPKFIVNSVGYGPKTVFPRYIKSGLRVPTKDQNCGAT